MDSARERIKQALSENPGDLFALGAAARGCDAALATALGYADERAMFATEILGVDPERILRAIFFRRLVEEGGYSKPSTNPEQMLIQVPAGPALPNRFVSAG